MPLKRFLKKGGKMNFIRCSRCGHPLFLRGDEQIITCPICRTRLNIDLLKLLYVLSTKAERKKSKQI